MTELLTRLGWSQAYFASLWGVSPQTVGRWCKGAPDRGAIRYLELCCRLLGV